MISDIYRMTPRDEMLLDLRLRFVSWLEVIQHYEQADSEPLDFERELSSYMGWIHSLTDAELASEIEAHEQSDTHCRQIERNLSEWWQRRCHQID